MSEAVLERQHESAKPITVHWRRRLSTWAFLLALLFMLAVYAPIFYLFVVVWRCKACWL